MDRAVLTPPRVEVPAQPLGRLRFLATFLRNPLQALPRAVYVEDFVPLGGAGSQRVWVTSPELVKAVLLDQREAFGKLTQIRLLSPLLGRGILTSEGAHWKWQRQAAAPMSRPADLAGYVPEFVRAAEGAVAEWERAPGQTRRIDADMTRATFEVVRSTLLRSADPGLPAAIRTSLAALERSGAWEILIASMGLPRWLPRPGVVRRRNASLALRATVAAMVRSRRRASGDEPRDLMHRLIAARDPETGQAMDDEQLVDNLLTFYLAGHETTAKALTWTLYLLSRSPRWSAALEDEVASVTGGAQVAGEHVERLVLVQQVLKESMRLYPPVPMMSRQAIADTTIGGHAIRAGMSILMPIYVIHRHEKRWSDPDVFDPTRFAPGNEAAIPRYQYMPFGAGPRICIGMSFALAEATAMLATFVQHARFAPEPGHVPTPVARVTLIPRGGMPLRVAIRGQPLSFVLPANESG